MLCFRLHAVSQSGICILEKLKMNKTKFCYVNPGNMKSMFFKTPNPNKNEIEVLNMSSCFYCIQRCSIFIDVFIE